MLRFLRIRNLAVVEAVEVEFEPGFNVLTGETGAGKSILVEAVGLLLGSRASGDLVRTGEVQATVEAIFEDPSGRDEIILRREITLQGRSRAYINGTLATAGALRDLAQRLVELHGQHEHQSLLDPVTHLPLVDGHANLRGRAEEVAAAWQTVRGLSEQLDRSRMDAREKAARLDLIAFQLGEIEKAAPKSGEDEELTATKQVLASAERVQRLCEESYAALYESDTAVLAALAGVWKRVGELAALDPQFASHLDARDGIKSHLEDLAFSLRQYADGVDASPERLRQVEDRLALLERLKRKYGPTLQDVFDRADSLRKEHDLLSRATENRDELERSLSAATSAFLELARDLSGRRRQAATKFSQQLEELLDELAMTRTRFEVRFNDQELPADAWSERGVDEAEFFISPNPGEELRPLARIVSGGELSRVMLALKTIAVGGEHGKTLIFDEVDAGIGGRVADVVGSKLRGLGYDFQVLCITHLPQIAARATTQFRIEKHVRGDRTVTMVERLDDKGRVDEIARMIGGAAITESVRASAGDLIAGGEAKGKQKAKGESESPLRRGRVS
jgi:DNA repair protein RecN (Recombination protein N)